MSKVGTAAVQLSEKYVKIIEFFGLWLNRMDERKAFYTLYSIVYFAVGGRGEASEVAFVGNARSNRSKLKVFTDLVSHFAGGSPVHRITSPTW